MGRYEEALERARQGRPIDEVFPELKESEDERIRKEILEYFGQFDDGEIRGVVITDWIHWLEKQKEQKPAEWSEEDERNKDAIIDAITVQYSPGIRDNLTNWLKSLRPQPHWKPSEEQMKHLERCFSHGHTQQLPNQHVLESLYNDLKKLM